MDQKKVKVINQRQKSVKANDSSRNKELLGYVCPLIERRVKKNEAGARNEGLSGPC